MKPGPFVIAFAALARVDEKTLSVHARALRDADVLPKGGRGPSGIEVDKGYLAALLISRMATDKPARAVEAFNRFAGMKLAVPEMGAEIGVTVEDAERFTLLDFVTLLCDPAIPLPDAVDFTFEFVGSALVNFSFSRGDDEERADLVFYPVEEVEAMIAPMDGMGDEETENYLAGVREAPISLHGIVESRSFNRQFLDELKLKVFFEEPD